MSGRGIVTPLSPAWACSGSSILAIGKATVIESTSTTCAASFTVPSARNGRESRLVFSQSRGNGGLYEYYICTAKQRGQCSAAAIRVDQLEDALFEVVAAERLATGTIESPLGGGEDVAERNDPRGEAGVGSVDLPSGSYSPLGLNNRVLVARAGLEPATPRL